MRYSAHGGVTALPYLNVLPADALRALILAQHEQLLSREREIEQLKVLLIRLHRMQFSPSHFATPTTAKPTRRALPEHLSRATRRHEPKKTVCPQCQGELRNLGEEVAEVLEYVPASFRVIRHVRTKLSCTKCGCIVQAEAPSRPI